jgi:hypothetical protein
MVDVVFVDVCCACAQPTAEKTRLSAVWLGIETLFDLAPELVALRRCIPNEGVEERLRSRAFVKTLVCEVRLFLKILPEQVELAGCHAGAEETSANVVAVWAW